MVAALAVGLLYLMDNVDSLPEWAREYAQMINALINGGKING
jgi:hypothetical protein